MSIIGLLYIYNIPQIKLSRKPNQPENGERDLFSAKTFVFNSLFPSSQMQGNILPPCFLQ